MKNKFNFKRLLAALTASSILVLLITFTIYSLYYTKIKEWDWVVEWYDYLLAVFLLTLVYAALYFLLMVIGKALEWAEKTLTK